VAAGDFNGDGSIEIAVSRLNDGPYFLDNPPSGRNWLQLKLKGTRSNRDGIGARLKLVLPSGLTQYEHVTTANGIYSASDKVVHFGLGNESEISRLEIRWPSGKVQVVSELGTNRLHDVVEPQ
jgi:hypothetical protein